MPDQATDPVSARARRRALARAHHPDLGGDADEFVRAMAELDRAAAPARPVEPVGSGSVTVLRRHRRVRAAARPARQLSRPVRRTLPRSIPGARRFAHYSTHSPRRHS